MIETSIEGLERAMARLREIGGQADEIAGREIVASAVAVQARAKQILTETAAVDTGRLRNSIAAADTEDQVVSASSQATGADEGGVEAPNRLSAATRNATIGTNVEYAPKIHYGTRRMPARPFLVPAVEEERPRLVERLEKAVKRFER